MTPSPVEHVLVRYCFHLRVRPDKVREYVEEHRKVWPDVLAALKAAGIRNYSIFMWKDGHEFGIFECDDWNAAKGVLGASEAVARWESHMATYLDRPVQPGADLEWLDEVFRLD